MVYKFFSGVLVESYGTWLLLQLLDDDSKDSDIPKNVPFAFAINNRNNRFGPGRRNLYSIYLPILEIKVLPAIVCLEGHNIASMHSKRFWSRLDTGDNIFPTLRRRFSRVRLGSRRVRLHAADGHRTCALEGFSPPPLAELLRFFNKRVSASFSVVKTVVMITVITNLPCCAAPKPSVTSTRTSFVPRTSRDPSPETSLLSFVTSLPNVVSSLRGFSRQLASPTSLPTTGVTLMPFKLCTRPLSPSCLKWLLLIPTLSPLILPVILRRRLSLMIVLESSFCLCRSVQGLFFSLSFGFSSPPGSYMEGMYMEGMSLTTPPSIPNHLRASLFNSHPQIR
jgi:hypothetical protein